MLPVALQLVDLVIASGHRRTARRARQVVLALAVVLTGCGKNPTSAAAAGTETPQVTQVNGQTRVSFGFNAEGGETPILTHTTNGWVAAYVGTVTGARHLYWSTSTDGKQWSSPLSIGGGDYSDQAPCFVQDGAGLLHLYFTSNRGGDDYQIFQMKFQAGTWSAPTAVPGVENATDLAVTYTNKQFVLAVETDGLGLVTATSTDGESFSHSENVAEAGFQPSLATLPDGKMVLAYMHDGALFAVHGSPGLWGKEFGIATGQDRLQEPMVTWANDHGVLAYCERTTSGYQLRGHRFDASAKFDTTPLTMPSGDGDARSPGLAADAKGVTGLIWGMTDNTGQQGIIFTQPTL